MIRFLFVKAGRFPQSVSDTYCYTKLFINDDVAEMMEFKEWLLFLKVTSKFVYTYVLSYAN